MRYNINLQIAHYIENYFSINEFVLWVLFIFVI